MFTSQQDRGVDMGKYAKELASLTLDPVGRRIGELLDELDEKLTNCCYAAGNPVVSNAPPEPAGLVAEQGK